MLVSDEVKERLLQVHACLSMMCEICLLHYLAIRKACPSCLFSQAAKALWHAHICKVSAVMVLRVLPVDHDYSCETGCCDCSLQHQASRVGMKARL